MKTLEDLERDAGKELAEKILNEFRELTTSTLPDNLHYALTGNHDKGPVPDQEIINWFYTPIEALDGKSPYETCKEGKKQIVENLLEEFHTGFAL